MSILAPKANVLNLILLMKNVSFLPTPSSISYMWNAGSLLIVFLMIQILSGVFISLSYNSSIELAFLSVSKLMRSVDYGWMIRLIHVNGASFYFAMIYIHIFRNLTFMSWKLKYTWLSGITIYLMSMMAAFLGYILPWGQMSFWAATVITNLITAIPMIGNKLVTLIWGSFAVSAPTLNRFFSFHFMIPFMIMALVLIHISMLHLTGSSNPIKISMNKDKVSFHPYFTMKDIMGVSFVMMLFMAMMTMHPYLSMDPDNFIEANPMVTPEHIQPEWYFLFAYSILRAIPNKMGGVVAMISSIIILYFKTLQKGKKEFYLSLNRMIKMSLLMISFIVLTIMGSYSAEYPFTSLMQMFSITYFISMLFI